MACGHWIVVAPHVHSTGCGQVVKWFLDTDYRSPTRAHSPQRVVGQWLVDIDYRDPLLLSWPRLLGSIWRKPNLGRNYVWNVIHSHDSLQGKLKVALPPITDLLVRALPAHQQPPFRWRVPPLLPQLHCGPLPSLHGGRAHALSWVLVFVCAVPLRVVFRCVLLSLRQDVVRNQWYRRGCWTSSTLFRLFSDVLTVLQLSVLKVRIPGMTITYALFVRAKKRS